jgi:hypothetical protein
VNIATVLVDEEEVQEEENVFKGNDSVQALSLSAGQTKTFRLPGKLLLFTHNHTN